MQIPVRLSSSTLEIQIYRQGEDFLRIQIAFNLRVEGSGILNCLSRSEMSRDCRYYTI
jgi:hypothetical protein